MPQKIPVDNKAGSQSAGLESARRLTGGDMALAFLIAFATDLLVGGRMLAGVLEGGLINPDSYMRLVRLDDILAKGAVLDSVMRDGSGQGTQLHWSRLIDSLLVLLAQPMHLFLPPREALHAAAAAFGPLGMGAMGIAVAWAAAPFAARRFLWLAPLLAGLSQPLVAYSIPGVVHHHLPLALVAVMIAGWAYRAIERPNAGAGLALGAWSGLGMWFTPEALPFVLLGFGFTWLAWSLDPRPGRARAVRSVAAAFMFVVAAALAVDPPIDGGRWFVAFDRLSVVYLVLAGCTALAGLATIAVSRAGLAPIGHFAAASLAGGACLGLWFAAYPDLFGGAAGLVGTEDYRALVGGIAEMQPVGGLADVFTFLLTGIFGAGVLVILVWQRPSLVGAAAALTGVLLVVAAAGHLRLTAYPAALGAAMLPVAVTMVTRALAPRGAQAVALARVAVIALAVLAPRLGDLGGGDQAAPRGACAVAQAVPLLAAHAGRVVLADVDDAPELLYRTAVRTVGSLYWSRVEPGETRFRRSTRNFTRLRNAWRSLPARDGPAMVLAAGAELVLHCARPRRSILVADVAGETLLDALDAGRPPPWLVEIGRSGTPGQVLYRVVP